MSPMKSRRYFFAMVTIRNQLFSTGGRGGGNTMETARLNMKNDIWIEKSMTFSVYYPSAVTLHDDIIVIGEWEENDNVSLKF